MATYAGVLATRSAAQTIPNTTTTALSCNAEVHDTDAYHDNSTNPSRLTVPVGKAGYYHIYTQIQWASDADGQRTVTIKLNGATNIATSVDMPVDTGSFTQNLSVVYNLAATDYVEVYVYHNAGGNLDVERSAAPYTPLFGMDLIGV